MPKTKRTTKTPTAEPAPVTPAPEPASGQRNWSRATRDELVLEGKRLLKQRNLVRQQRDQLTEELGALKRRIDELEARNVTLASAKAEASGKLGAAARSKVSDSLATVQSAIAKLYADLGIPEPAPQAEPSPVESAMKLFGFANFFKGETTRRAKAGQVQDKYAAGKNLTILEQEILAQRHAPLFHRRKINRVTPPPSVAFVTVANDKFLPGLIGLLLSLKSTYPDIASPVHVFHDGTLSEFVQTWLTSIYPAIHFDTPDMDWLVLEAQSSDNHKRIGKLGYMNFVGLTLDQYERVILLDSDVLVIDDISALWEGDAQDFRACYDCGDREYVAMSAYTGAFIINSGVISIPRNHLGAAAFSHAQDIVRSSLAPIGDLIDRFADQKSWNVYLRDKPVKILETNYNTNIKYAIRYLEGNTQSISIIHFAGPKPWNNKDYLHESLVTPVTSRALSYPKIWTDLFRKLYYEHRLEAFTADARRNRSRPVKQSMEGGVKTCVLIGNGPSIADTPLELVSHLERFCFNWFLLHKDFEDIAPDHLVLASHMFFGGWNVQQPAFPEGYLERLRSSRHRPVLWTSYYYKPLFDSLGLSDQFEVNYLLFEKPFKRFMDNLGNTTADARGFLDDGRTGVLSFACPIARSMGFDRVVLVGCDSNYNNTSQGTNYFYDEKLHTSLSTRGASLTSTWQADGAGHFAYEVMRASLAREGVELVDATIGGALHLPKMTLHSVVQDAAGRSNAMFEDTSL